MMEIDDGWFGLVILFFFVVGALAMIFFVEYNADDLPNELLDKVCQKLYGKEFVYEDTSVGQSQEFVCTTKKEYKGDIIVLTRKIIVDSNDVGRCG